MSNPMFDIVDQPGERNLDGLSPRDAHKRRTADLLRVTAMRMFARRGYDATTAEDIAEKAGVSVRTFFRYYATKDELVLKGQGSWAKRVAALYLDQPDEVPAVAAMCEAMAFGAGELNRKAVATYGRIVDGSQMLRGKVAQMITASHAEIARAVAEREGIVEPDARARLLTEVAFATYQSALKDWRDERVSGRLEDAIRDRFALLTAILNEHGHVAARSRRAAAGR